MLYIQPIRILIIFKLVEFEIRIKLEFSTESCKAILTWWIVQTKICLRSPDFTAKKSESLTVAPFSTRTFIISGLAISRTRNSFLLGTIYFNNISCEHYFHVPIKRPLKQCASLFLLFHNLKDFSNSRIFHPLLYTNLSKI